LNMIQTDSAFSITRQILGHDVVISLTDAEAEQIVRQWVDRSLEKLAKVQEPETKQEWKPVKAYSTGVLAQHMDDVISLYKQGLSPAKIGEIYGVSATTVRKHLVDTGLPMRNGKEAIAMWRQNRTAA